MIVVTGIKEDRITEREACFGARDGRYRMEEPFGDGVTSHHPFWEKGLTIDPQTACFKSQVCYIIKRTRCQGHPDSQNQPNASRFGSSVSRLPDDSKPHTPILKGDGLQLRRFNQVAFYVLMPSRYFSHSIGSRCFFLLLHSLQQGTKLPFVLLPPREMGTI